MLSSFVSEQLVRRQGLGGGAYKTLSPSPMLDPRGTSPGGGGTALPCPAVEGGLTLLEHLLSGQGQTVMLVSGIPF